MAARESDRGERGAPAQGRSPTRRQEDPGPEAGDPGPGEKTGFDDMDDDFPF